MGSYLTFDLCHVNYHKMKFYALKMCFCQSILGFKISYKLKELFLLEFALSVFFKNNKNQVVKKFNNSFENNV